MAGGWIKLHRKLLSSSIWRDPDIFRLWSWCLLKASYHWTTEYVRGTTVELQPGQFVFSLRMACKETGLSEQTFRRCIKALQGGIDPAMNIQPTRNYSIATVVKWKDYQNCDDEDNTLPTRGATHFQHTSNTLFVEKIGIASQTSSRAQAGTRFKEEEIKEKKKPRRSADLEISATIRDILAAYRQVSGRNSIDANTREGARILAEAVDTGDLSRDQVKSILKNGLADGKLPNQGLRGIAKNFNRYLPVAERNTPEKVVVRLVCDTCGEESFLLCSRNSLRFGSIRQHCTVEGCEGIQRTEEF